MTVEIIGRPTMGGGALSGDLAIDTDMSRHSTVMGVQQPTVVGPGATWTAVGADYPHKASGLANPPAVGHWFEWKVPVPRKFNNRGIYLHWLRGWNMGRVRLTLNGTNLTTVSPFYIDFYATTHSWFATFAEASGIIEGGLNTLRAEIIGKHASSTDYYFGLASFTFYDIV